MATKIIMSLELIESMVNRLNNKDITIVELSEEIGCSRRTLTRKISQAGYSYDRTQERYISQSKEEKEMKNIEVKNVKNKVGRPKSKEELEKHTYALPKPLIKALRRKAVEEDKKVVEVVRELLTLGVEDKYFKQY